MNREGAHMTRPHSVVPKDSMLYGLGFWLDGSRDAISLEGYDAGVSFRSVHDRKPRSLTPSCPTRPKVPGQSRISSTNCSCRDFGS
jgi:hypothetical protein